MTRIILDEGIEILFGYDVALRLTEKRSYQPDSRVILANVPTGLGVDFNTFAMIEDVQNFPAIAQALPYVGRTDIMYRPFKKRPGEVDEYTILNHYAPGSITPDEQRVFERHLKSIVLADDTDDLDRIRLLPQGKIPTGRNPPEPDLDAIAEGLQDFYADDEMIEERLGIPYNTRTMTITPLQIRLSRVRVWGIYDDENPTYVSFSSPGLPQDYLQGK